MDDLRRLRYFLEVARERNFTRAAQKLHIAQPALSRQVRALEQELGVELLHRTTHDVELTAAGALLLERGPRLLAGAEELWRAVRSHGSGEEGYVVIAYGASASYETAPKLLEELAARLPGLSVRTEVRAADEILAAVAEGSVDVGIVRCAAAGPGLQAVVVRRERQGVLCRRDHPVAATGTVTLDDIADQSLLMHPREANPGHFDAIVGLFDTPPDVVLRTLSFDLAQTPIARGETVAIVGESSRDGLPAELCWVPLDPEVAFDVSLVARSHHRSAAAERVTAETARIAEQLGWTAMPERAEDMP